MSNQPSPPRRIPPLHPPLINSATPWSTTLTDLTALFSSPYTGAITTRTSLRHGFPHNPLLHKYRFLPGSPAGAINTFGYSPLALNYYLSAVLALKLPEDAHLKPVIISITGSMEELKQCFHEISAFLEAESRTEEGGKGSPQVWVEVNLSCPNIPNQPPPAYDGNTLGRYMDTISKARSEAGLPRYGVKLGLKLPPYTYQTQFEIVIERLKLYPDTFDFLTACNTLGTSLCFPDPTSPSELPMIGGLSGPALHPLALGNVHTLRKMLDKDESLRDIAIIGIGGVSDREGFERMRKAGADVVGVGVGFGVQVEQAREEGVGVGIGEGAVVAEGVKRCFGGIWEGVGRKREEEETVEGR